MNKRSFHTFACGTPQQVITHATWRHSRGRNRPTMPFNGINNPTRALNEAQKEAARMGEDFGNKLAAYLKRAETEQVPFKSLSMATFAPGLVAVRDSMGETDTYFDASMWEAVMPEIWKSEIGNHLFPPALDGTGIGVLPGIGTTRPMKFFRQVKAYALDHLKRIGDKEPNDFKVMILVELRR